jgi:hypothetical protein
LITWDGSKSSSSFARLNESLSKNLSVVVAGGIAIMEGSI